MSISTSLSRSFRRTHPTQRRILQRVCGARGQIATAESIASAMNVLEGQRLRQAVGAVARKADGAIVRLTALPVNRNRMHSLGGHQRGVLKLQQRKVRIQRGRIVVTVNVHAGDVVLLAGRRCAGSDAQRRHHSMDDALSGCEDHVFGNEGTAAHGRLFAIVSRDNYLDEDENGVVANS